MLIYDKEKQERGKHSLDVYLDFVNSGIFDMLDDPYCDKPVYKAQVLSNNHHATLLLYEVRLAQKSPLSSN